MTLLYQEKSPSTSDDEDSSARLSSEKESLRLSLEEDVRSDEMAGEGKLG